MKCAKPGCTAEAKFYPVAKLWAMGFKKEDVPAEMMFYIPLCEDDVEDMGPIPDFFDSDSRREFERQFDALGKERPDWDSGEWSKIAITQIQRGEGLNS